MLNLYKVSYLFLRKVVNDDKINLGTKLLKINIFFSFLLPYCIVYENRAARSSFCYPYLITLIVVLYLAPFFWMYFGIITIYVINLTMTGFSLYLYTKAYPSSIKTLDKFLYTSYLRYYFLGNPGTRTGQAIKGLLGAYAFKLGGSHIEHHMAINEAKKIAIEAREAGNTVDFVKEYHSALSKKPLHATSDFITQCINKTSIDVKIEKGKE